MTLFNSFPYNDKLYNGPESNIIVYSTDLIVFEGLSLSDNTVAITEELLDSGPDTTILGGPIPRDHGEFINARYFRNRVIEARGIIQRSTAEELDAFIDTMRKTLRKREGVLDITRHGSARRYIATLDNMDSLFDDRQGHHITYCPFKARFTCKTPFAHSRTYSHVDEIVNISPTNIVAENIGTVEATSVILLIFDSASSITEVTIQNTTNGETIGYAGSIAANDTIEFNGDTKTVLKNGEPVAYSGAFPVLQPGSNLFEIHVSGSSFSAIVTIKHRTPYL